jgi:hypothetical protein
VAGNPFGSFSGFGFTRFADYLCPANTDGTGAIARKFASLFGVEQADIDQMNQGGCPGGSIFSASQAGAFNRDATFLVNVLDPGKSQTSGNLFNGNEASLRLDYNLSENNRFFAQFNWARSRDNFYYGSPRGFGSPSTTTTPNFQLSYIQTFSPTLLNELRVGYIEKGFAGNATTPGVPSIRFDDGTLGFNNNFPVSVNENIYSYSDMVAVGHGKHNLKAGADLRRSL